MEHRCVNCGKVYDPNASKFFMYGFGPECVKKFLSGELDYADLVRDGASPFGITDDVVKRWLPEQINKEMDALLNSKQWEVFRDPDEGLPRELLKEYVLGASPISTAIIDGRVSNMRAFAETMRTRFTDENDEEGLEMIESFLSQMDQVEKALIEPDGIYNNAIPTNRTDYHYLFNLNIHRHLVGEPVQKKEQGDYDFRVFDTASRYAFQLAKVGSVPEGIRSGVKGMVIQSAFDALTDPKGENEFFRVSSYLNSESFAERMRSFPNAAVMRDVLLTDAILATSDIDTNDDMKSVLQPLRKYLSDSQIQAVIRSSDALFAVQEDGGSLFDERKRIAKDGLSPAQYINSGDLTGAQKEVPSHKHLEHAMIGQFWFSVAWGNKSKKHTSKIRLEDFRRGLQVYDLTYEHYQAQLLARNELKRVLKGEKKLGQNSLAPLALAISALANKDEGYFANVIRVKDGVIDSILPALSKEVTKNEGIFTASMRAHAALKATFWKNEDFFRDSKEKGYEYFVATSGHSRAGHEYKTSFHIKPRQVDSKTVFDDSYGITESGRKFIGGQMTQVWSLNSDPEDGHEVRDASWYRLANQDVPRIPKNTFQDTDRELVENSKFIKNLVKRTYARQSDEFSLEESYLAGVNGMLGQCGASFASQVKRARNELPVTSEAMELLKDAEISIAGYSAAGLNYDPASIMTGGDIVTERIPENPVIHESVQPSPIKNTLNKIFKT
ncbi:hypothetical protein [Bdellovibrio sp. BCCA]|uniref:hypothetical protein n=1 Tax=Bdellovibrio sp. BCCA TaxID=3136281 RepID=UPI0030F1C3CC